MSKKGWDPLIGGFSVIKYFVRHKLIHLQRVCAAVFSCRTACRRSLCLGTASLCQTVWWRSLWSRSGQTSGYPADRRGEPWTETDITDREIKSEWKSENHPIMRIVLIRIWAAVTVVLLLQILQRNILNSNSVKVSVLKFSLKFFNTSGSGSGSVFNLWSVPRCCCWADSMSDTVEGSDSVISFPEAEETGLGRFALRATLVPFDTNMNTSLWDCRNYRRQKKKRKHIHW